MAARQYGPLVVDISNENKRLFPDLGLTKGHLVDYYEQMADFILPQLHDRALMLQRFPDGITEQGFYQKQVRNYFPSWIDKTRVNTSTGEQDLVVCNMRATLVWLASQAVISLHHWLCRIDQTDNPDLMIIDLDPPQDTFAPVREAAFQVRELLDELGLPAYAKLTGSRGIHVITPLDRSESFDAVRDFARRSMQLLAARNPKRWSVEQRRDKRQGCVYLDTTRNAYAQTVVAPYSVRPFKGAPVAAPISWDQLRDPKLNSRSFTVQNVRSHLGVLGEPPWHEMMRHACGLGPATKLLATLRADEGI